MAGSATQSGSQNGSMMQGSQSGQSSGGSAGNSQQPGQYPPNSSGGPVPGQYQSGPGMHGQGPPGSGYHGNMPMSSTSMNGSAHPAGHPAGSTGQMYGGSGGHQMPPQQMMGKQQKGGVSQYASGAPQSGSRPVASSGSKPAVRKAWHAQGDGDNASRQTMTDRIVALLQQRRPNANPDWHDKLPHMARRLEEALYNQANSLEEYLEHSTLKARLQHLALQMGGKQANSMRQQNQQMNGADQGQHGRTGSSRGPHQGQMHSNQQMHAGGSHSQSMPGYHPSMQQGSGYPQGGQQGQSQMGSHARTAQAALSQYPGQMGMQQGHQQMPSGYQNGMGMNMNMNMNRGGNMGYGNMDANDMNQHSSQQYGSDGINQPQQRQFVNISQINSLVGGSQPQQSSQYGNMPQGQMRGGQGQMGMQQGQASNIPSNGGPIPGTSRSAGHSEEHRKQVLKQQQQRLLLLRHASKCPHENGHCPVTPHCASMKQLWKHIMSCKDQECTVGHCVSSRYVLSHYSKCKDPNCPVCGPVREAIRRNYERSQSVIKMGAKNSGSSSSSTQAQGTSAPAQPPVSTAKSAAKNAAMRALDRSLPGASSEEPPSKKSRASKGVANMEQAAAAEQAVVKAAPPQPKKPTQLDPVSCALYGFQNDSILSHIRGIHEGMRITAAKVKEICMPILDEILRLPHSASIFGSPVDPTLYNLPDYFDIVKEPMDLGSVRKKLETLQYRDLSFYVNDVHLTFDNAMLYNPKNSDVHILAKQYRKEFDSKYKLAYSNYERTLENNRLNEDACPVCGEVRLAFEPPVYYCNGRCGGQRIRRNAHYYSTDNNAYHWCSPCFSDLKEGQQIRLPDCTLHKADLARNKKKHTEESEESWVACDGGCGRWVHHICALFNSRRNFGDDVLYVCPFCLMDRRRLSGNNIVGTLTSKMRAVDLPQNSLTQFIEQRLAERLEKEYRKTAVKSGCTVADVEKCPQLVLRQVSSIDKNQPVREGVRDRYKNKNYPIEFPCRTKCVVLFQNIDGQDVILFGMYVYEYGHKCPAPNQRRVYVSYLDSVHYLRPKRYRTAIYHEILIAYLEYVKRRGFHTAHIWSCPPSKGDDYILYCHPVDQKTPKTDKLQKWYADMLDECVARGIAHEVTDLHTEFLANPAYDATVLPYFEGDYWTTEAEVIIKALNEGQAGDGDDGDDPEGSRKSKRKSKSKHKSRVTRTASSANLAGKDGGRDPVMAKLASIIEPMKNTFFVARLYPQGYADKYENSRHAEMVKEEESQNPESEKEKIQKQLQDGEAVALPSSTAHTQAEAAPVKAEEVNGAAPGVVIKSEEAKTDNDFEKMATAVGGEGNGTSQAAETEMKVEAPAASDKEGAAGGESKSLDEAAKESKSEAESGSADTKPGDTVEAADNATKDDKSTEASAENGKMDVESKGESGLTDKKEEASGTDEKKDPSNSTEMDVDTPASETKEESSANGVVDEKKEGAAGAMPAPAGSDSGEKDADTDKNADDSAKEGSSSDTKPAVANGEVASAEATVVKAEETGASDEKKDAESTEMSIVKQEKTEVKKQESAEKGKSDDVSATAAKTVSTDVKTEGGESAIVKPEVKPLVEDNKKYALVGNKSPDEWAAKPFEPNLKEDTEDVDDTQESEHWDTRQSFLNLCQGNHYQFDQLRRAKYTSMMVLYLMHNPDAPKFVPNCNVCHTDILQGNRHRCEACDVDFCQSCVQQQRGGIHPHPLRVMPVGGGNQVHQLTEAERRERQRTLQLHLQLLQHAAYCTEVPCKLKNCSKMKDFLKHVKTCPSANKGCPVCKKVNTIMTMHARSCRVDNCKVLNCLEIRQKIRQMALKQQQMDDRRRAMINDMYHTGGGGRNNGNGGDD